MTDTGAGEKHPLNLMQLHRDAMDAANRSWSETDKLYVSVCSALVAVAAIFGRDGSGSRTPMFVLGVLLLLLAVNWLFFILRYQNKIGAALKGLMEESAGPEPNTLQAYFAGQLNDFNKDWTDYLIVAVVFGLALLIIGYALLPGLTAAVCG